MSGVKRSGMREENTANITPLADVTTTLIVVFLITMPAIMGNGIKVNATRAESNENIVAVVALGELEDMLRDRLATRIDKTVVIVPSDFVRLGDVVDVMDAAKGGGAQSLALLNRKEGDAR